MLVKLSTVIASHLEDIKFEGCLPGIYGERAIGRANFIKFLIYKFKDLNEEIDPEEQFQLFVKLHPNLAKAFVPNPSALINQP